MTEFSKTRHLALPSPVATALLLNPGPSGSPLSLSGPSGLSFCEEENRTSLADGAEGGGGAWGSSRGRSLGTGIEAGWQHGWGE